MKAKAPSGSIPASQPMVARGQGQGQQARPPGRGENGMGSGRADGWGDDIDDVVVSKPMRIAGAVKERKDRPEKAKQVFTLFH